MLWLQTGVVDHQRAETAGANVFVFVRVPGMHPTPTVALGGNLWHFTLSLARVI